MKKILLFIILLFIPFIVKAEDITYELCKNGCEYNDINNVFAAIKALDTTKVYNITIDIKDGETYEVAERYMEVYLGENSEAAKSTITYKGPSNNHPTLQVLSNTTTAYLYLGYTRVVNIENINVNTTHNIVALNPYDSILDNEQKIINIKNSTFTSQSVSIEGSNVTLNNVTIEADFVNFHGTGDFTINNSKITANNSSAYTQNSISFSGYVTINNSEIESKRNITANSLFINNSTIKAMTRIETMNKQVYKNTKIDAYLEMRPANVELDNVEVTLGLGFSKDYCDANATSPEQSNINIKNSKISNQYGYAISMGIREKYKLNIDNSDLGNSFCSISASIPMIHPCSGANTYNGKIMPTYLSAEKDSSNIVVTNSTVNCAMTGTGDTSIKASNMYFDYTNKWTKPIIRSDVYFEYNEESTDPYPSVFELNGGRIFIEFGAQDTLILNVDKDKNIADYFKAILPEGQVLGEWFIEDETILKVVDGKIVPLKVGRTAISAIIDNNVYSIYITVEGDDINPNTGGSFNKIALLIVTLVILSITCVFLENKKIKGL